jgi:hypothetical protein
MNDVMLKPQTEEIVTLINKYYDASFRMKEENCLPFIQQLLEKVKILEGLIAAEARGQLQIILQDVQQAMQNRDYVLVRDKLHYELRTFVVMLLANIQVE